ncbi:MAG: ABC transporter transmembrane domain-containing protein, partial [Bacteroidota bacterium]
MSKNEEIGKAFDFRLFKRVFAHTRPYRVIFWVVAIVAILSAAFAVLTPILVRDIINKALSAKDEELLMLVVLAMLGALLGQVICQLSFNYYANLLGESVIKDIRVRLFQRMMGFKMTYFDNSSIGVLVTRAVADMQRIGEIFSQGFFVIVADTLKMLSAAGIMLYINWKLAVIVFAILPIILIATRLFQQAMK